MAALLLKTFAAVFVAVFAVNGARVSAQTNHVLGGDGGCGPSLDLGSWLSGRIFRVGDKISFDCSGTEDSIVELERPEDFHSCDLTNPIRMYSGPVSHAELEKKGNRYFTSANPENCKNGLKLTVPVQSQEYEPEWPPSPFEPTEPPSEYGPPEPIWPPPEPVWPPPKPVGPPPEPIWPPPEPVRPPPGPPSAAASLNGLSLVMLAGLLIGCVV